MQNFYFIYMYFRYKAWKSNIFITDCSLRHKNKFHNELLYYS